MYAAHALLTGVDALSYRRIFIRVWTGPFTLVNETSVELILNPLQRKVFWPRQRPPLLEDPNVGVLLSFSGTFDRPQLGHGPNLAPQTNGRHTVQFDKFGAHHISSILSSSLTTTLPLSPRGSNA